MKLESFFALARLPESERLIAELKMVNDPELFWVDPGTKVTGVVGDTEGVVEVSEQFSSKTYWSSQFSLDAAR